MPSWLCHGGFGSMHLEFCAGKCAPRKSSNFAHTLLQRIEVQSRKGASLFLRPPNEILVQVDRFRCNWRARHGADVEKSWSWNIGESRESQQHDSEGEKHYGWCTSSLGLRRTYSFNFFNAVQPLFWATLIFGHFGQQPFDLFDASKPYPVIIKNFQGHQSLNSLLWDWELKICGKITPLS